MSACTCMCIRILVYPPTGHQWRMGISLVQREAGKGRAAHVTDTENFRMVSDKVKCACECGQITVCLFVWKGGGGGGGGS